jgi:predicted MFS family arabinose efflux permease
MTLTMALMRQTASEAQVGRAMGLLGTVSALGTALGPTLGGILIPFAGWRGAFWVQVPLALVTLHLAISRLPNVPAKGTKVAASLRSALTLSLIPMLVANLLVAAVMMTTLVVGPFYLALGLGLRPLAAGLVMALGPILSIISGIPSGRLVDQWGCNRVAVIGLSLLAAGAVLLAFLPSMIGLAGYVVGIVALTPGYQLFQAANNTAALAEVQKDGRGMAAGLLNLSRNAGLITGASAMGAVFAYAVGTGDFSEASASALNAGMSSTFLLAAALMVLALVMIASRQRQP